MFEIGSWSASWKKKPGFGNADKKAAVGTKLISLFYCRGEIGVLKERIRILEQENETLRATAAVSSSSSKGEEVMETEEDHEEIQELRVRDQRFPFCLVVPTYTVLNFRLETPEIFVHYKQFDGLVVWAHYRI